MENARTARHKRLYSIWDSMKRRCRADARPHHRKAYFDKGIKVCIDWFICFDSFKKWSINNGYRSELELDRKDGNKGYNPDNCQWITHKENMRKSGTTKLIEAQVNQIKILKNRKIKQADIAEIFNISRQTVSDIGRVTWL